MHSHPHPQPQPHAGAPTAPLRPAPFPAEAEALATATATAPRAPGGWLGPNGAVKRGGDIAAAAGLLLFLLPLLLLVAAALRLSGPAFYCQKRVGRGGRVFPMLKFRTMHTDAEARLAGLLAASPEAAAEWGRFQKLERDPRITPLGRWLRVSSVDELPQLLNVLWGQMSLVGPRPLLPGQREAFGRHLSAYTAARPGLTGLWQIRGRSRIPFRGRARLCTVYRSDWTLARDLWILWRTVPALLLSRDAF